MVMTDCVVVGAGLIGMLTAHELATRGMQVTILERGQPARESSWAGGGI
ncbi:MAG: FAD-dependent oxidoreductase, partial [Thiogranum sp.]